MELISYNRSEKDGINTTTIVFNPTKKPIWVIPKKGDKNHGTLISYDPVTGRETCMIEFDQGKVVGEKIYEHNVTHVPISSPGELEPEAWVWAIPQSQQYLRDIIIKYVAEQKKMAADTARVTTETSDTEVPNLPLQKNQPGTSIGMSPV